MPYSMKEFTMKIQTLMTALVLAASGAAVGWMYVQKGKRNARLQP